MIRSRLDSLRLRRALRPRSLASASILACAALAAGTSLHAQTARPEASAGTTTRSASNVRLSDADEPVTLDVFNVSVERDVGFVAASSLAGGRLAGELAETPVAYSVQTREFLEALNISDRNEALNWTVNATTIPDDGSGQLFGGTGSSTIRGVGTNAGNRNFFAGGANPSTYNMERMDYARGPNSILFGTGTIGGTANVVLKGARIGRNATELRAEYGSWESYRAAVDANYTLPRRKVAGRVTTTWQDTRTYRDFERTKRKGVSPSLTIELTPKTRLTVIGEYYQQDATAGHVALMDNFTGWDGKTVYSGIQPSNLPSQTPYGASRIGSNVWVVSPASGRGFDTAVSYTGMMQTISYSGQRPINGVTPIAGTNLGFNGAALLDMPATPDGLYDAAVQGSAFRVPSRSFTNIGPNTTSVNRLRDVTFFLDQRVGRDLNFQLSGAANKQYTYGLIDYYLNNGYPYVRIDINRQLPDGAPNPNFLQPYNEFSRPELSKADTENRALRLAAAYLKDTRWVDIKANAMAGIESSERFSSREYFMIPYDADPRAWGLISSTRTRTLNYRYYWNQGQREIPEMREITLLDPAAGTSVKYNPLWVIGSDRNDATTLSEATTQYYQAAVNLSFWRKRVILLGAFRMDQVDRTQKLFLRPLDHPADWGPLTREHFLYRPDAPDDYFKLTYVPKDANGKPTGPQQLAPATRPRNATTGVALPQYAGDRFQDDFNTPDSSTRKPTKAVGGIVNVWRGLSLWANFAQTFNPADFSRLTIDWGTPPASTSEGVDYGVRYSLGPRFYLTASRFESRENDATSSGPSGYSNLQLLLDTNALGDLSSGGKNRQGLGDVPNIWNDVLDRRTKGYELEAVANFTPNWRLTLNYGYSHATQTDAYRMTRAWMTLNEPVLRKILDDAGIQIDANDVATAKTGVTTAQSPDLITATNAWNSLRAARLNWVTGTQLLNRLTKYTANFYSDYRFTSGNLSGLRLGYGMQFRGPQVIGYRGADTIVNPANPATAIDDPNVDAYTPVWQKAYFLATATVGYPVKIARRKIELNLSITNLFDYDKPLYNNTGLRAPEGNLASPARITYPRYFSYTTPRSFRLSATYTF